jgi:sporulation protein YlmC with PRC-barrel domain
VRVTDLNKRKVLDVSSATTIGRIEDVVVDPTDRRVLGFRLRKTPGKMSWLAWEQLKALGPDALTVDSVEALTSGPDDESTPPLHHGKVIGGLVLTDEGLSLGALADVDFDADSGVVTALLLEDGRSMPGESLRGIGSYATMVAHPGDSNT